MTSLFPEDQSSSRDVSPTSGEDEEVSFGDLWAAIVDGKIIVVTVFTVVVALGAAKAILDTPVYKADALLQVQEKSSSIQALDAVDFFMENNGTTAAEIEIAKSRKVLGATVDALNLTIVATPDYFPIIGQTIARRFQARHPDGRLAEPWLSLGQYAWGGEAIHVETFNVPEAWLGMQFSVIVLEQNRFELQFNGRPLVQGTVGTPTTIAVADGAGEIDLNISQLRARPGTKFTLVRQPLMAAINELSAGFTIAEKVRNTGILSLSYESTSPLLAAEVLKQLASIYVRENIEQKLQEAAKSLDFLDNQLPAIKKQLEASVSALEDFKVEHDSIDLNLETQNLLASVVDNKKDITLLQEKKDELRAKFTENYPAVVAIDKQIARLQAQMAANERKIEQLPEIQQVILRLTRDVEVNSSLYTTVMNNTETLRVAKAGTIGNVRIIDQPVVPTQAVRPNRTLIMLLAAIVGAILGVAAALLRNALRRGIQDPLQVEAKLNLPVYAAIPHSEVQAVNGERKVRDGKRAIEQAFALALENKEDSAVESLRSLRTTLHFAFFEAKNNTVMITGPNSGSGSTFVATNLAIVLADAGKKILLIDGNLRKGSIHRRLGVEAGQGLSELIAGSVGVEQAVRRVERANIDFLPTGMLPPNPSELLLHQRFEQLIKDLAGRYDHIIVDAPPVLTVTDTGIIGRIASVTLLVVKAGQDSMHELESCVKRLALPGVRIKGVVFNDLPKTAAKHGDGYVKYEYRYSYKNSA